MNGKITKLKIIFSSFQVMIQFDKWFLVEPLMDHHRVILMKDFVRDVAQVVWPRGNRTGNYLISFKYPCFVLVFVLVRVTYVCIRP